MTRQSGATSAVAKAMPIRLTQSVQLTLTCCGELRADCALTVILPLALIWLTVTTCCLPPSSDPLSGVSL